DAVGGGERLAGDADLARLPAVARRELEERVHHLVGNPVADLVRMAFGHRLAGEQIARARHCALPAGRLATLDGGGCCSVRECGQESGSRVPRRARRAPYPGSPLLGIGIRACARLTAIASVGE